MPTLLPLDISSSGCDITFRSSELSLCVWSQNMEKKIMDFNYPLQKRKFHFICNLHSNTAIHCIQSQLKAWYFFIMLWKIVLYGNFNEWWSGFCACNRKRVIPPGSQSLSEKDTLLEQSSQPTPLKNSIYFYFIILIFFWLFSKQRCVCPRWQSFILFEA